MFLCLNVNYNGFTSFMVAMDRVGEAILGRASFFEVCMFILQRF